VKSRRERPRKTKIGTEVAHVTRDSDTTFKVKGQLAGDGGILWQPPAQLVFNTVLFAVLENHIVQYVAGDSSRGRMTAQTNYTQTSV